ncbi:MAG: hypothetical protein J0I12_08740 [Candidatus Eremiobacteraeota bacterium]|nr:hypothetical protein [Candidatus Eremiobacteraeota bacterium]
MMIATFCRVCGYEPEEAPWGESGQQPTYQYCPCCNTQFGVTDAVFEQIQAERKAWIEAGMPWRSKRYAQPEDWNPLEQIGLIPYQFVNLKEEPELVRALASRPKDEES